MFDKYRYFLEGQRAAKSGDEAFECPYEYASDEYQAWMEGYYSV